MTRTSWIKWKISWLIDLLVALGLWLINCLTYVGLEEAGFIEWFIDWLIDWLIALEWLELAEIIERLVD